jgi:hypothetical protein
MEAIKIADPLALAPDTTVRRAAKELLIDAHLAVARDIAWGRWQQKERVVPLWLERAKRCADEAIDQDGGGRDLRLRVAEHALLAAAGFQAPPDPTPWVRMAEEAAEEVTQDIDDPLWKQRIDRQLSMAYFHAMRAQHVLGQAEQGLAYGKLAVERWEQSTLERPLLPEDEHILGLLFFQLGAIHAVHRQDHREAVRWYEKAAPALVHPTPLSTLSDPRRHGDALVSMGVSFWEVDQKEKAVELTKMGAELLHDAIAANLVEQAVLAVPYANLATMLGQLGKTHEAQMYAKFAEKDKTKDQLEGTKDETANGEARRAKGEDVNRTAVEDNESAGKSRK